MTKEEEQRLNQIRADQANRYNDGWAHERSGAQHQAYLDIEFLLSIADPDYPQRYKEEEEDEN